MSSRIGPHIEGVGRVMVTDHGAHPPEFWAQVTAEHIAPIADDVTGRRRIAALTLQAKIAEALEPHHAAVQADEADKLLSVEDHCDACVSPEAYIDDAMTAIRDAAVGTEWEEQFSTGHAKPVWYDAREEEVYRVGADNAHLHMDPLTPGQIAERDAWLREGLIRSEIGRHFANAQHIAKLIHKQKVA
jgi:hypothetical protein